ncbi:MAG: CHAT domain-containing protein, partial [Myxococcales bacterium]|nr:CHAT domain-containing protein [Myxococcales bacterium]
MDYQNFDLVVQVRDAASRTYSVLANGEADVAAMDTFSLQANWETLQALADRVGRQATLARSAAGAATAEQVMVIQSDTVPSDAGLSLETVADLPAVPGGVRSFAPQIEGWEGEEAAILLARDLGQQLHHAVFTEKVQTALRSARAALPPGVGLRFRLRLEGAPELHRLPWEYLHDGEGFLALQAGVPVVRHVEEVTPTEPLQVSGALRLLVVVSAPSDQAVLDVEGEVARLKAVLEESVAAGRLEVDVLEDGRWSTLEAALTPGEGRPAYHILHFIGHGTADAGGGGRLYFEGEDGTAVAQDAEGLTALLVNHPSLRLVVLNACQGATSDELDARSSIAARLVGRPAPAVVAMQYAITDRAALDFSRAFYGALAMGNPVDTALALARAAEFRRLADGESPRGVEWGTPVLYLRARDGRLFAPAARAARFGPRIGLAVALALLRLGTAGALATRTPYYQDGDRDGYGAGEPVKGWSAEDGWVARAGDCDDENRSINPDAVEQCDAVDHDCDGNPHNGVDVPRWFPDSDGDGHGDRGAEAVEACGQPKGFVASRDDCDDRDASTHPGAQEQCDDVDHDCQGGPTNGVTYSDWFRD